MSESTNKTIIRLNKKLHNIDAIKIALFNFLDKVYSNLDEDENEYLVEIEPKENDYEINSLIKNIKNSILEEETRLLISKETGTIRNMIYEKAMNLADKD